MTAALFTMNGAATETGRDRKTITRALRGVPPDGKSGRWDGWYMTTILDALTANGTMDRLDLTVERSRLTKAQADDREMKNELARGDQITVAEFHMMVTAAFARVRSKLLALPSKLAPLVVSVKTPAEVQAMLKDAVHDALNELAATTAAGVSEDGGFDQGGA